MWKLLKWNHATATNTLQQKTKQNKATKFCAKSERDKKATFSFWPRGLWSLDSIIHYTGPCLQRTNKRMKRCIANLFAVKFSFHYVKAKAMSIFTSRNPKDAEGNIFTDVCPSTGAREGQEVHLDRAGVPLPLLLKICFRVHICSA